MRVIWVFLFSCLVLSACGKKGKLYRPENPKPQPQVTDMAKPEISRSTSDRTVQQDARTRQ